MNKPSAVVVVFLCFLLAPTGLVKAQEVVRDFLWTTPTMPEGDYFPRLSKNGSALYTSVGLFLREENGAYSLLLRERDTLVGGEFLAPEYALVVTTNTVYIATKGGVEQGAPWTAVWKYHRVAKRWEKIFWAKQSFRVGQLIVQLRDTGPFGGLSLLPDGREIVSLHARTSINLNSTLDVIGIYRREENGDLTPLVGFPSTPGLNIGGPLVWADGMLYGKVIALNGNVTSQIAFKSLPGGTEKVVLEDSRASYQVNERDQVLLNFGPNGTKLAELKGVELGPILNLGSRYTGVAIADFSGDQLLFTAGLPSNQVELSILNIKSGEITTIARNRADTFQGKAVGLFSSISARFLGTDDVLFALLSATSPYRTEMWIRARRQTLPPLKRPPVVTRVLTGTLEDKPLAPLGIGTIQGTDLCGVIVDPPGIGPLTLSPNRRPLPTEIGRCRVLVDGNPVPLFFGATFTGGFSQINFQLPAVVNKAEVMVERLTFETGTLDAVSQSFGFRLERTLPVLFKNNGLVILQAANRNYQLVDRQSPVQTGDVLVGYGTNFGLTSPVVPAGLAGADIGEIANTVETSLAYLKIRKGDEWVYWELEMLYSIASPEFPGVSQIAVRVPEGLAYEGEEGYLVIKVGEQQTDEMAVPLALPR